MENINYRQESLGLRIPNCVVVVGCGGVGSWVAKFLALAGVPKLWLFDHDTVADHNRNRLPVPENAVGKTKTMAMAEEIIRLRPNCAVIPCGLFDENIAAKLWLESEATWIVATTDRLSSRKMVQEWANKRGIYFIEAAAEGEMGSATGQSADWSTADEDNPGYASVPVWVGPCVFAAATAVAHVLHNVQMRDRTIRLGWNKQDEKFGVFDSARN